MEHDPCLGGYEQRWRASLAHGKRYPCPSVQKESSQWAVSGADQGLCSPPLPALSVCLSERLSVAMFCLCQVFMASLTHGAENKEATQRALTARRGRNPRKEAGSKCDSWCPGQRECSGTRDKLNSQGLGMWE